MCHHIVLAVLRGATDLSHLVPYIMPARFNSINTIAMQIMLIRIPIGPLLILEDGLMPRIGSALLASFSSISAMGFMITAQGTHFMKYSTYFCEFPFID